MTIEDKPFWGSIWTARDSTQEERIGNGRAEDHYLVPQNCTMDLRNSSKPFHQYMAMFGYEHQLPVTK